MPLNKENKTQLNDQTILFLRIQFSIGHLFALSLNVRVLFAQ